MPRAFPYSGLVTCANNYRGGSQTFGTCEIVRGALPGLSDPEFKQRLQRLGAFADGLIGCYMERVLCIRDAGTCIDQSRTIYCASEVCGKDLA